MKKISTTMSLCFFIMTFLFAGRAAAANYYWVGGTGNWSAYATHWATTSGGNVFHVQVPTSFDNVYFDANSFTAIGQLVTLDTTIGYCQDMDWTGALFNPTFEAAVNTMNLKIFGSLKLTPTMIFAFNGKLLFTALSMGKTIETFSHVLNCNIEFVGPGGEWTLQDSLTTTKKITLTYGILRSNNQNIRCNNFESTNTNLRGLYLGTSVVSLSAYGYAWNTTRSIVLDADSSIIKLADGGLFRSEGHTYNILEWDSIGGANDNEVLYDSLRINKIISKNPNLNSTLELDCQFSQVDTIIARGKLETFMGQSNFYKYVSVDHDAAFHSSISSSINGDSIIKMTVGGGASFAYAHNYVGNLAVQGYLYINSAYQTFDTCSVGGDATILSANNQLGMFSMTPGKTLTLRHNVTQYIDSLGATGTPGFPIQVVSYDLGYAANVVIQEDLCTDYLYIHAVHASGNPALYVGTHSNDVSNNTGWIFNNCIMGTEENDLQELVSVYPNPATAEIKLNVNNPDACRVQLSNTLGEILFTTTTSGENIKIDVSDFPSGIYFVSFRDKENNSVTKKIIKM